MIIADYCNYEHRKIYLCIRTVPVVLNRKNSEQCNLFHFLIILRFS